MKEHESYDSYRNALEWYHRGKDEDDYVVKFIMHWIAFNWLYDEGAQDDSGDKNNLRIFYQYHKRDYFNPAVSGYNPFNESESEIFTAPEKQDKEHGADHVARVEWGDTKGLLLAIYQVRCNLFHGAKSMYAPRSKELVKSSSVIMERYLEIILDKELKVEAQRKAKKS